MKLSRGISIIALAVVLLAAASTGALARQASMVFWYPGEAGSTAEGQPVLDAFFAYLNPKLAPASINGRYFNAVDAGMQYIRKDRPVAGIVSNAAWQQHASSFAGARVLLAVLPFPGGSPFERYLLVSASGTVKPGARILSSEPMEKAFVKKSLFPNIPDDVTIATTPELFASIKKIADGTLDAAAILTPSETASLAGISAAWSQSLKKVAASEPVPTARVVLFDPAWTGTESLRKALLAIGSDPAAQEILSEMRLKGFAEVR